MLDEAILLEILTSTRDIMIYENKCLITREE